MSDLTLLNGLSDEEIGDLLAEFFDEHGRTPSATEFARWYREHYVVVGFAVADGFELRDGKIVPKEASK